MTLNSNGFIFIWLLLAARNLLLSGQIPSITLMTQKQMTTQQVSSLSELSEGLGITSLTTADVTPTETQIAQKIPVNTQPAGTITPFYAPLSGLNATTQDETTVRPSLGKTGITQASTELMTTPLLSDFTPTSDTVTTSDFMKDKTPDASTHLSHSTKITWTPTKEDKSDGNNSSGTVVASTVWQKTPAVTSFIHTTKAKNKQDPPDDKAKPKQGPNHGNAVAGIIGGALLLMMVAFVGIYMKKRKIQKQQITTTDWAGPSPFLEAGANSDQATKQFSNRISLNSFLPQRLSKRLSLLPETDEELEDMTPGITFGNKYQGNSDGRKEDGDEVQESNGTSAVVTEKKNTGDKVEADENTLSQTSDKIQSTNNNSEATKLNQNQPDKPSILSEEVENASGHMNNGLE